MKIRKVHIVILSKHSYNMYKIYIYFCISMISYYIIHINNIYFSEIETKFCGKPDNQEFTVHLNK